ncbi:hypothetical protein [Kosakonia cowanii]|uniref:phage tail fiber protein n=1 Tax=Kosakonia cowanii TaxID=208223 RepID=UPI00345C01E5
MCRGSWNYATNKIITDTNCGDIQLAGAVVEVMGSRYAMTIRVTTGAVAKSGDTMTGRLNIFADNDALSITAPSPGAASYMVSRDSSSSNQWYIGKGEAGSNDASFINYKGGNNGLVLRASGRVELLTRNSQPLTVNAEIVSTNPDALRMAYGEYGAFWRQDNANTYLLLTNKGDPYGNYNALRPLTINNATGNIYIDRLSLNDYSNFDARYHLKNTASLSANGWFKDAEQD